ncbi:MAG: hypothetical protein ACP5VN_08730 [Acidobacteriota bacterium]
MGKGERPGRGKGYFLGKAAAGRLGAGLYLLLAAFLLPAASCAPARPPAGIARSDAPFWVDNDAEAYGFSVSIPGNWDQGFLDPSWREGIQKGLGAGGEQASEGEEEAKKGFYSNPRFVAADRIQGKVAALLAVFEVPVVPSCPLDSVARQMEGNLVWSPFVEKPLVRAETHMVAGMAWQYRYRFDLPVDEKHFVRLQAVELLVRSDSTTYVLLCLAPDGIFKKYVPLFNRILDSFAFRKAASGPPDAARKGGPPAAFP